MCSLWVEAIKIKATFTARTGAGYCNKRQVGGVFNVRACGYALR